MNKRLNCSKISTTPKNKPQIANNKPQTENQ